MGNLIDYETSLKQRNLKGKLIPPHVKINDDNTKINGGYVMSENIKREEFEQFKYHIDSKFDRVIDKIDENRKEIKEDIKHQSTTTIAVISLVVALVGIIIPIIIN
ncbi:hypothetical protein N7L96_02430 [Mammaliicoccus sciuri]|uniref:hypothetical protein n=1 Tax=Mammaliicoccus sciuri TaxID=1296 RepID=UPI001953278C|nr:hypothetical protein [Mammaliicoccus sciuri]MDC5693447.1 hypothetical protein [Mammaliicoccus sciuri]